ncbi:hypothetical protein [Tardiphaga sp. vice278]|uniref:hypothetical protein n=1 Tax=Tardiphaga sp. vice278 TaxID=2592815 RepID=UPI0011621B2D|nr:hypothetical protein [Tardiphaga sp. vice278]QDM17949.1 hypothetical protein FNL53_19855 [Tardiphaga sp. vice278]
MNLNFENVARERSNLQAKINLLLALNALANLHLRDRKLAVEAERGGWQAREQELLSDIRRLEEERTMMLVSRSWRLTAPLRWFSTLAEKRRS